MDVKMKQRARKRRQRRVRIKIKMQANFPRLCVFRSNRHIYAQLIDDEKNKVLEAASDLELNLKSIKKTPAKGLSQQKSKRETQNKKTGDIEKPLAGKIAVAFEVGKLIAKKALEKKIEKVVFDRGSYKYHGRVKALAEGAREGGLKF